MADNKNPSSSLEKAVHSYCNMSNIDPPPVDMNDTDPPAPVELDTFKKWNNMIPFLQNHTMEFFDNATMYNYAQCSKLCNTQMHRVDKHVPKSLEISEWIGCEKPRIVAELKFLNRKKIVKKIEAKFDDEKSPRNRAARKTLKLCFSSQISSAGSTKNVNEKNKELEPYNGHYMDALVHYLTRQFKHIRKPAAFPIWIDIYQWPAKLANFLDQYHSGELHVRMRDRVYKQFMDAMKNNEKGRPLRITVNPNKKRFKLPRDFFDSKLFQKTKIFDGECDTELSDDQLLSCDFDYLVVYSATVSPKALNQKLVNIFNKNSKTFQRMTIMSTGPDRKPYSQKQKDLIMNGLPFKPHPQEEDAYVVENPDGSHASLMFYTRGIAFRFNSESYFNE